MSHEIDPNIEHEAIFISHSGEQLAQEASAYLQEKSLGTWHRLGKVATKIASKTLTALGEYYSCGRLFDENN